MSRGRLAEFVRTRRKALGMTQAQLAATTGWSKSSIEKVEAGRLVPSLEFVGALFDALAIAYLYRERIIAALYPGTLTRILGPSPSRPDADALADLEDLPYPAAYLTLPEGDVLGANSTWAETFPGMGTTANLLTWLFTAPQASEILPTWERLAHGFAYGLRVMGPISVPETAVTELVDRCSAHPDFERMWTTDPPDPVAARPELPVVSPATGEVRRLCVKIDKPHFPFSSWVTYRLVPIRDDTL
ncbi:helix-turn-helix domain-containing protein [Nocardia otitidiscaviarum]|uniref:Helix-turn-helix domain-containing protein n=1 Tax=Nocardia otitidiscaviarum TaxID=1823 RepID=A0A516NU15_9NOCA|nr:helix-turn-helix domain-containing protein [Nocardia otitidiscaviarum]MCP9621783.1 helix-turn-helix domain-containing protein [Nocardia otitidiscaviarum]QDP82415.1 helix-turn-helix domain-containing protein [Nocardia otitidiscaviarum]